ncbi:response regulator transcription factor [Dyadobacter sp. CY356]|uniref:LuxR C-terminal-related transcriptional regulator n=1 Tax=Dyadobacter sp. CY356 TaxID=2906442 RepID=UPI001F356975|nr:response regulator transcription factor [Dyadobacter sp. CY356]MCF0056267.1 response regulator transcription factor [Dyadobacter sp. CY356]
MITIALVDKHPVTRIGLIALLKDNFNDILILESSCMTSFLKTNAKSDVTILGINPDSNAGNLRFLNKSGDENTFGPVIIYDEEPRPYLAISFLRAGVMGYLSKQNDEAELIECITDVLIGMRYVCKEILGINKNVSAFEKTTRLKENSNLTFHEYEIAQYICQGVNISEIAQIFDRKTSTISTIKMRILKKLKVNNILELRNLMLVNETGI